LTREKNFKKIRGIFSVNLGGGEKKGADVGKKSMGVGSGKAGGQE